MSTYVCPKCGSVNIWELYYGSSCYQCADCKYSGDFKEFLKQEDKKEEKC